MNAVQKCAAACVLQSCALGVTLFFGTAPSAVAAQATSCSAPRSASLDARMAAKADQGPAELGRFVRRVGAIYQLDYATAVSRVERVRRDRASCEAQVAVS
jgi:hypothetical protein